MYTPVFIHRVNNQIIARWISFLFGMWKCLKQVWKSFEYPSHSVCIYNTSDTFCAKLVSWCFEPSQPCRITSGLISCQFQHSFKQIYALNHCPSLTLIHHQSPVRKGDWNKQTAQYYILQLFLQLHTCGCGTGPQAELLQIVRCNETTLQNKNA